MVHCLHIVGIGCMYSYSHSSSGISCARIIYDKYVASSIKTIRIHQKAEVFRRGKIVTDYVPNHEQLNRNNRNKHSQMISP